MTIKSNKKKRSSLKYGTKCILLIFFFQVALQFNFIKENKTFSSTHHGKKNSPLYIEYN